MPARRRVGETPIARRTFDKIASSDGDDDDGAEAEADDDEDGSASLGAPGCATARARRVVVRRRLRAILSDLNARAGDAAGRVAAPAQIAKDDVVVRKTNRQFGLDVSVGLFALHQDIAEKDNAVAIVQSEAVGSLGGDGGDAEAEQGRDKQGKCGAFHFGMA